jgi:hypothetical protein
MAANYKLLDADGEAYEITADVWLCIHQFSGAIECANTLLKAPSC